MPGKKIDPLQFYRPFPRQEQFHRSCAKYRLFGGAAGPGKTKALLWEAIRQANKTPKADTLLLRRTFPELEKSLLKEFRRSVPPILYCGARNYNESKHIVTWPNGSTTQFGYCESDNDVYQYQGGEYLFIGVDELTFFSLKQWQFLTSRNRCPVPGSHPNMAGATNPGNVGHMWVKALWIDKKPPAGMEDPMRYDPTEYEFIAAKIADNPIYANDIEYRKTLDKLPKHQRDAFLEGSWDVFAGQYFDVFDVAKHRQRIGELAPFLPRWISIDWGFEHPSAVLWHAEDEQGRVITYREIVKNHLAPIDLATLIADRTGNETIQNIYLSPDAYARRTDELTIAEQLGQVFASRKLPEPTPADNDRVGGWMLMYDVLRQDRWVIADTCPNLIESLPTLTRDPDKMEDCLKFDGDDVADSARYGLKTRLGKVTVPKDVQIERTIQAWKDKGQLFDPTQEMIRRSQLAHELNKQAQPIKFAYRRHRPF